MRDRDYEHSHKLGDEVVNGRGCERMSDCPYHLTPEDTGERRRRTGLWIRLLGGHLREAVKALLFSGGFTLR